MGKIRKAILQKEAADLKKVNAKTRKEEEWDVSEEGFYKDEVDEWNDNLLLTGDMEPASFSEDEEGSDTEVLPLDLPEGSEDESNEEDIEENGSDLMEELEEDTGGPSDKAWGYRKSNFYNTDFIGDESVHSSDESMAEEEEKEAVSLQRRLLESLDPQHFGLDSLKSIERLQTESQATKDKKTLQVIVPKELSDMSAAEQFSLLEQQWPEFLELYEDLSSSLKFSENVIKPIVKLLSEQRHSFTSNGSRLLQALQTLNDLYCLNVMFYLSLRANQIPAEDHPVIKRIIELRDALGKVKSVVGGNDQLLKVLEDFKADSFENEPPLEKRTKQSRKRKMENVEAHENASMNTTEEKEDPLEYYYRVKASKIQKKEKKVTFKDVPPSQQEIEESLVDGKRSINYQIAQNKGLTPKRKKDQRNPRVKHRKKYVKAVKKYQKVAKPLEREMQRYGGEKGGIKARLSRSVKLK